MAFLIASHPELCQFRSIVLDLAYEEFCLRRRAGEELSAEEFSGRFPSYERSLYFLIEVNELLDQESGLSERVNAIAWPEPGSRFLGFEVIGEIGRGAFGRVYLAAQPALGSRLVAVKVTCWGGDEAEILGRLDHPNIVPLYSVQQDERLGVTAFCMPYLGRATLGDVLDQAFVHGRPPLAASAILEIVRAANGDMEQPSSPARVLRRGSYVDGVIHLARQMADALAYSHQRGVYHRDLKPSNVLLAPDGRPLLLDFNLSLDDRLPGCRVGGTLPYMAPEELAALTQDKSTGPQRYDPRSDVFSLGVLIHELLTGHHPFGAIPWGRSVAATADGLRHRQLAGPQPLREANAQVDARLARLVESCLASDPDERPRTARELATALQKELAPWRRARRWMRLHRWFVGILVLGLATLVLTVTIALALRPPYSVRQYQRGFAYSQQGAYKEAIECFSDALHIDPTYQDALIARGHASQELGDFAMAYDDYKAAYRLPFPPPLNLCRGYCLNCLHQEVAAMKEYQAALEKGETSPVLFNNLGYTCRVLNRLDEADAYLRRAVKADHRMQAAYHNLVLVCLRRAMRGQLVPKEAFEFAQQALSTGSPSGDLYHDVAILYAIASQQDHTFIGAAIEHVGMAVESGIAPDTFRTSPSFAKLQADGHFRRALSQPVKEVLGPAVLFLDPLASPVN
jgi:serine/threonine protein kinase/Flp pilus assembly protein TadD